MATSRRLLRGIAGIALLASATGSPAQFVPPAGYSGSGPLPGVAPNPDPSTPKLTRLSDADMSRLIKPDPSYRRGTATAHAKVVGAFAIDESKAKVASAWSFGFMPITLALDDGRCFLFMAAYLDGTLSNGRLELEDCNGRRPVQEAAPPAPPAGQALRYVGQSWTHAAWANDRTHTTIVTVPTRDAFKPLFTAKMDPLAMLATAGIDYPGGNVTLVGRVDGRLVILTLEVGY